MARSSFILLFCLALGALGPRQARAQFLGCPAIDQLTLDECEVLKKLYEETNGDEWLNFRGWLRTNQPCDWLGITCASTAWPRKITKIHLSGNNLTGSLPGELSLLTELKELVIENSGAGLRFKKLTGTIPPVLGNLSNLEVLSLSENDFTGGIPPEFRNLTQLRILELDGNKLTGPIPAVLGEMTALEQLDLSNNQLAGSIPVELAALEALQTLALNDNLLNGAIPPELGTLANLSALDLSNNDLTGSIPETFSDLSNLFRLSLAENDLSGPLPLNIASFTASLTTCFLEGNALCLPETPPYQALGTNPICGVPLNAACSLCGASKDLAANECTALEEVYLGTNGLGWTNNAGWLATETPCDWFGVTCSEGSVTSLAMPANNLDGSIPAALGSLADLTELDLSANTLQGEIPAELGNLTHLQRLDLSANQMTGIVPITVATLGAATPTCSFADNDAGLCIPDTAPYQALGANPICGLPLRTSCQSSALVEVLSFQGHVEGESVVLFWETDRGSPDVRFEVERKVGEVFEQIGSVDGTGTADQTQTYTFRVTDLGQGTHIFRLKQVAGDGAISYSVEASVLLTPGDVVLEAAYPNPFRQTTTLRFAVSTEQEVTADLYDVMGRHVRALYAGTLATNEALTLQITNVGLPSGFYVVRITGASGFTATEKILLVK